MLHTKQQVRYLSVGRDAILLEALKEDFEFSSISPGDFGMAFLPEQNGFDLQSPTDPKYDWHRDR